MEAAGGGNDTIATSLSYVLSAGSEVERLQTTSNNGTAAINLTGNEFANTLSANAGNNVLDGKGGADWMEGRGGDDTYFVDNAGDRISEDNTRTGGGYDIVAARVSYTLADFNNIDVLRTTSNNGTARIDLTGNNFGQIINGNAGSNVLNGRFGHDVLTGFGGADTFVFDMALDIRNIDRIADFSPGVDKIRLDNDFFTTLPAGRLAASAFKDIAIGPADGSDRILYDSDSGALFYDPDGSGAAASEQFASLANRAQLTASDFLVID